MKHRSRRRFLAAGAAALVIGGLSASIACGTPYGEKVSSDDANEALLDGGEAGASAADPCEHTSPKPGIPAVDDDTATELPPFVVAVEAYVLGGTGLGYDVDGVCTCDSRVGTAFDGGESCSRPQKMCDDDGGVDNSFANIVNGFAAFGSIQDLTGADERIKDGRQTVLVYVRRYNGLANDLDVEIGLLPSDGLRRADCPDAGGPDGDGNYPPKWCGDDTWSILPTGTLPDGTPIAMSDGFVRDHHFYVALPGTTHIGLGQVELDVGSSTLSGTFVPLGDDLAPRTPGPPATEKQKRFFRIEGGQLSGRLSATSLLGVIGALNIPGEDKSDPSQRICRSPLYVQVRKEICNALDVARTPTLDFQGVPCDAISTSIGFTAMPARSGETFVMPRNNNDCLPVNGAPKEPSDYAPTYDCPQAH